jgi:tripartite-type tricarboxylate transporter receptor subunit TctC
MIGRRAALGLPLLTPLLTPLARPGLARAQGAGGYPDRPIRVLVAFAPGGQSDTVMRLIAPKMQEALGQSLVIENRTGAGGSIAGGMVAQAAPDGYTLILVTSSTHAISPNFYRKPPYNPVKEFAPVTLVANAPEVVVVHPSVPANSIKELIALAKARPDSLNYASAGTGTIGHMAAELFKVVTGTRITHVPYKGTGDAIREVLGGQVQIMIGAPGAVIQHVRSGKLRALAACTRERLPELKEIPTMAEAGYPAVEASNWYAILSTAGTPAPVIGKLNREIVKIMQAPDIRELILRQGYDAKTSTPEELGALIRTDLAKWAKVVKETGMAIN